MIPNRRLLGFCFLIACLSVASHSRLQAQGWKHHVIEFQEELNRQYLDPKDSPMDSLTRLGFTAHSFFPIAAEYRVRARFVRTPAAQPFEMPTVSGKTKTFVKYGELYFWLNGRLDTLCAYQNVKLAVKPEYANDLFIPFKDWASGEEAYGGGRYIDWEIPKSKKAFLDFNLCYNPYCAYSTGWNCPIPPQENYVDSKVLAGIKAWEKGH